MDTIDYLLGARISNTTAPLQRCRAHYSKHKHGASVAFIKEYPQLPVHKAKNEEATQINRKTSTSVQPLRLPVMEKAASKAHEGSRKLPEVIVSAPPREEKAAPPRNRRAESPAKRFLRSWT
ncbi:hypothetical protein LTR08_005564 [Meristemomyces frigidus]|nr:hypothetical protein LTR08_005564 [Meristemomyces frigidus]